MKRKRYLELIEIEQRNLNELKRMTEQLREQSSEDEIRQSRLLGQTQGIEVLEPFLKGIAELLRHDIKKRKKNKKKRKKNQKNQKKHVGKAFVSVTDEKGIPIFEGETVSFTFSDWTDPNQDNSEPERRFGKADGISRGGEND